MREQQGASVAPSIRVAATLACVLTLAGCTWPQPDASAPPTPPPSAGTPSSAPTPEPGVTPAAVVTIAAMDVDAANVTLAGMVTLVEEDGGTCTFVATSAAGVTVERETSGIANVSSTSCGSVQIPAGEFARGSWEVVVRYSSPDPGLNLVSDPLPMEIP